MNNCKKEINKIIPFMTLEKPKIFRNELNQGD